MIVFSVLIVFSTIIFLSYFIFNFMPIAQIFMAYIVLLIVILIFLLLIGVLYKICIKDIGVLEKYLIKNITKEEDLTKENLLLIVSNFKAKRKTIKNVLIEDKITEVFIEIIIENKGFIPKEIFYKYKIKIIEDKINIIPISYRIGFYK